MVAWAVVVYGFIWWYLARENKKRARGDYDDKIAGMSDDETAELGDRSPKYEYTI